jgi:hypothetical protein
MPSASGWAGNWAAGRCLADKHLKESGLKAERGSGHALRLSATTWSRVGGARLEAIAGMLGHTSVTTTGVYAKVVDKIAENPARYLGTDGAQLDRTRTTRRRESEGPLGALVDWLQSGSLLRADHPACILDLVRVYLSPLPVGRARELASDISRCRTPSLPTRCSRRVNADLWDRWG